MLKVNKRRKIRVSAFVAPHSLHNDNKITLHFNVVVLLSKTELLSHLISDFTESFLGTCGLDLLSGY